MPISQSISGVISESASAGTVVANLYSSTYYYDQDTADVQTFKILKGDRYKAFDLSTKGSLTVHNTSALQRNDTNLVWNLTVAITDSGNHGKFANMTAIGWYRIVVSSINHAPTLDASQKFSIFENATANTVLGTITAYDKDSGQSLSFYLKTYTSLFTLTTGGVLSLTSSSTLSYKTKSSYTLWVKVFDNYSPTGMGQGNVTVTVKKSNYAPVLTTSSSTSAYFYEKTKHAYVWLSSGKNFTLNYTDVNSGTGETYKFVMSGGTAKNRFILDSSKGVFYTNSSAKTIVYQSEPSFTATCYVLDSTGLKSSSVTYTFTTVNIIDPPTVNNATISTYSGVTAGSQIGSAVTANLETGDSCSFYLRKKQNGNFSLSTSGYLYTTKTLPSMSKNYTLKYYCINSLLAHSTNNGTIKVRVWFGYDAPTIKAKTYSVREDAGISSTIVKNLTVIKPSGYSYSYTLALQNYKDQFSMNSSTGAIKLLYSLNVNIKKTYNLTVLLTSTGPGSITSVGYVILSIVDEPNTPYFTDTHSTFTILETATPGTNITSLVTAVDQDSGQNATLRYNMTPSYPSIPFSIRNKYVAATKNRYGQIYLDPRGTYKQLNYITKSTYTVTITSIRDLCGS